MKNTKSLKQKFVLAFYTAITFITQHKITSAAVLSAVAAVIAAVILVTSIFSAPENIIMSSNNSISIPENTISSNDTVLNNESAVVEALPNVSSEEQTTTSIETPHKVNPPVTQPPQITTPVVNQQFNYNSNMSPDSNVFLDALEYTGYNLTANRKSGLMWASGNNYVLCSRKRGLGWLSNITYGGGSTGYETTENGLPNIHSFERGGLVCATYATYVYFNYLPNVAGIDTSSLMRPERSYDANCWYIAGKQWVDAGYSRYIDFTANDGGSINRDINFSALEDIPIGSLICLQDWYNRNGHCTHICIYAGKVNGYHWVTHVGNENGPEFCAIERMNRNPHPQWPLAIITTPSNIRFSAAVEVSVKDENGNPIKDVPISIKRTANGAVTNLGSTNADGKVLAEGLSYGEYQITQTVTDGYVCDNAAITVNFTTQNNSLNTVEFINRKIPEVQSDIQPTTDEGVNTDQITN